MRLHTLVLILLAAAAAAQDNLVIDGDHGDAFWQAVPSATLSPREAGVPAAMGGSVRAAVCGAWLCLSGRFPEPGGKVLARSIGRNPIWEIDATNSPPVEDRVEFRLSGKRNLTLAINPWGAWRVEQQPGVAILAAAQVSGDGWTIEAAVPLAAGDGAIQVTAERIRSRRALAPEFRWTASLAPPTQAGATPLFRPPPLGNQEPPLEIGKVAKLPPVIAEWDDPAWRSIPSFELPRHEPSPRAPRYPTQVKWAHDGRTLSLLFRAVEPEPVVARSGGRDSNVTGDDHVAIYLATSGSAALEIAVNSAGAIRDAIIRGPRIMRPDGWNPAIQVQTHIGHGGWVARINIPLEACAAALGETGVPARWRILLSRLRAARPGEAEEVSALPFVGTSSYYGPVRYRAMFLAEADPARVQLPAAPAAPQQGFAALDSNVWTPLERRYRGVRSMVSRRLRARAVQTILDERRAWDTVKTREDWERFRDPRLQALRESAGVFPPERPPLDVRVSARHAGRGYRLENLAFQSRPGYYVTANLYLPDRSSGRIPAMIIVHSQHYPKTQGELHDMGELWARAGAAVLVIERPGYGERAETNPWYRQAYASRFIFTKQLFLAGESYSGWVAWDIIRSVDFLHARPEIDRDRIILLGSVAGGGEPAAVAAALDPRITAVVPFNYDQGHIRVHGDSPGQIARQFTPWLVAASVAPRRFVRAFEFGWEGAEEPDFSELWVDGYERSRKVWDFYGAGEHLAAAQAYGLIRLSMERASHCFSIGPQQREGLYPIFQRWFGIPLPAREDLEILPDSELSASPQREEARKQEAARRRPHGDLVSITPAVAAQIERKKMHQVAHQMGSAQLQAARAARRSLSPDAQRRRLREDLRARLGDIEPAATPQARAHWTRSLPDVEVEAISLEVEEGISVPLLLLRPRQRPATVVVAISQGGKDRFLKSRAETVEALLKAGVAVVLPDVRGVGETAPSADRGDGGAYQSIAQLEFDLGGSLLGSRLKDLRSVLGYLRTRSDLDSKRIALWGDSFAPANPRDLILDEVQLEGGPQIQHRAEPLGAHLALLAALYEDDIRAIAAQGGLAGYLSVLESAYTYVPMDVIVHGILKAGDIADIAAALAPRPQLLEALVDGRNVVVEEPALARMLSPAVEQYRQAGVADRLAIRSSRSDVAAWIARVVQ